MENFRVYLQKNSIFIALQQRQKNFMLGLFIFQVIEAPPRYRFKRQEDLAKPPLMLDSIRTIH